MSIVVHDDRIVEGLRMDDELDSVMEAATSLSSHW